jgi:GR25 family glycosyltransferase involved in LPS biosynthesis
LECNEDDAKKLEHNRDLNGFKFHIENVALSNRPLMQKHWDTMPYEEDVSGWTKINTIPWKDLKNKYDYTIIFEDDLKVLTPNLYRDVEKILDDLNSIQNNDFDIIFLGNLKNNHGDKIINNIYTIDKNNDLWGTQSYLINNKSTNKILKNIQKIDKPIDVKYQDLLKENKLKGYIIYPILVTQNGFDSTINIHNKKFNKKFL